MKIIHVAGYSGSGKTTFIRSLIPLLSRKGTVGVIKHLHSHSFELHEGKDTTLFYEAGAMYTAGIDPDKAVVAIHNNRMEDMLTLFSDRGADFAIIEGFKETPFPKVVIGDYQAEECVLRDPSPEDVAASLALFPDYYTIEGVVHALKKECNLSHAGCILSFNGIVREITDGRRTEHITFPDADAVERICASIEEEMKETPGILGAAIKHRTGRLFAGEDITYIALCAERRPEAFEAAMAAIDRLKSELHNSGLALEVRAE